MKFIELEDECGFKVRFNVAHIISFHMAHDNGEEGIEIPPETYGNNSKRLKIQRSRILTTSGYFFVRDTYSEIETLVEMAIYG